MPTIPRWGRRGHALPPLSPHWLDAGPGVALEWGFALGPGFLSGIPAYSTLLRWLLLSPRCLLPSRFLMAAAEIRSNYGLASNHVCIEGKISAPCRPLACDTRQELPLITGLREAKSGAGQRSRVWEVFSFVVWHPSVVTGRGCLFQEVISSE